VFASFKISVLLNPYSDSAVVPSMHQPLPNLPHKPLCILILGGRVSFYLKSPETVVQVAIGTSHRKKNDSITNVPGKLVQAVPPRNWSREMRFFFQISKAAPSILTEVLVVFLHP